LFYQPTAFEAPEKAMILNTQSRKLQVVLTTAATTSNMSVLVDYTDTAGDSPVDDMQLSSTNGTTAVDICFAPANGVKRDINGVQIHNQDTAAKIVQVSLVDNGTAFRLISATLQVGDTLGYTDAGGWYVQDTSGNKKNTSTISGLLSTSASTGIGYATGAGAAVTQITNRSTGVTVDAICGTITTDTTSLAAGASAEFTVTNSAVEIGDVVVVSQQSGSDLVAGVAGTTIVEVVTVAAGSFILSVNNNSSTTAETGAIILNFAVIKAVAA
jgi:hypothetical protein